MSLENILLSENVGETTKENIDYLLEIIPELRFLVGIEYKNNSSFKETWNQTLKALDISKADIEIRLALLLHSIGKPFSIGEVSSDEISERMAREVLLRLNCSSDSVERICFLILNQERPITKRQTVENINLTFKLYEMQRAIDLSKRSELTDNTLKKLNPRNVSC